ncbi:HIT family protein [Chlamydiales bacterium]|nr:HIT family protein [Chlamydiales bacterium]
MNFKKYPFLSIISIYLFIPLQIFCESSKDPFCNFEIIENQSVFKTEYFNVLIDYEPNVRGHLLVIPKRHIVKAHELSKKEWEDLSNVIPKIVNVFSKFLHTDQYIILEKNGPQAFQTVPHVHFHLIPVHNQTWSEIFNIKPQRLNPEE